jgi:hypothetical protein
VLSSDPAVRATGFFAVVLIALAACHPGGEYVQAAGAGGLDRGETNGRQFDFVSNKIDGDDWQFRLRGSSFWASYARADAADKLGTVNLNPKETKNVWRLIDALEMTERKKGKKDEDEGYVTLRLREPGDDQHDIYTVYVSRTTEDEDVIALGNYLVDLVDKYFKEKPHL